jgi:hypothetical protein
VSDAVRQHRPPPEGLGDGQLLAALVIGHGWRELAESLPTQDSESEYTKNETASVSRTRIRGRH